MKKVTKIFAVAVMASLAAVACTKSNTTGGNDNNGNNNGGGNEEEGIVIDGQFEDWAALAETDVVAINVLAEARQQALRTLKFHNTEDVLYGDTQIFDEI